MGIIPTIIHTQDMKVGHTNSATIADIFKRWMQKDIISMGKGIADTNFSRSTDSKISSKFLVLHYGVSLSISYD